MAESTSDWRERYLSFGHCVWERGPWTIKRNVGASVVDVYHGTSADGRLTFEQHVAYMPDVEAAKAYCNFAVFP